MTPFPLAVLEQAEISPYIAYTGPVPESGRDCVRTLPVYTWWGILRGGVAVATARDTFRVGPGGWVLIPHGLTRRQRFEPGTRLTSLSFRALWPSGRPILEMDLPLVGSGSPELERAAHRAGALARGTGGGADLSPLAEREFAFPDWIRLRAAFLAFVERVVRAALERGATLAGPFSGDPRLDVILGDLRRDLRAGALPYAAWRDRLRLGRAQIDRLARHHLGVTLRARRDELLRDEIRRQLAMGLLSAKELAARHRFVDAAHFSRWVRRMTGHSPRELRAASAL